jgi:hypothetical protein
MLIELSFIKDKPTLSIEERADLYKKIFKDSRAIEPVKAFLQAGVKIDRLEALEAIRELNTALSELYMVSLPVITVWVRDTSYVPETGEIYLTEPDLEDFLHQFRHHLQNVERKYDRRGLTAEGLNGAFYKVPYEKCLYKLRGEDDARAWAKFLIEISKEDT